MLKKLLKWTGIVLGCIVLLLMAAYAYAYFDTESRINKVYETKIQEITIPTDSVSIASGEHIAEIRGCKGCHGADLAGGRAFADPASPIGLLYSSNITSGKGGISYTKEDWVRALRHGVGKDGHALWFMPSQELYMMSNQDVAELIGYVSTRPPVDKETPKKSLKPLGRVLTFLGEFPLLPAEVIDHNHVYKDSIPVEATAEYGKYLAMSCIGCHGPQLKGAPPHGPNEPPIPDITLTGEPGKWDEKGFVNTIRTGKTPAGKELNPAMPWKDFTFTDQELSAVYAYVHSLK